MEIKQGNRRRNNKLIFITAGVIVLLLILARQPVPNGKLLKIRLGDSVFQVANRLNQAGIAFRSRSAAHGDALVVDYQPVSGLDRLRNRGAGSVYEIYIVDDRVALLVWRAEDGSELGRPVMIRLRR